MAADVKHLFQSGKSDGPDQTVVQPTDWNDSHKASGGAPGQAIVWDPADTNKNMGWGRFDHFNFSFNSDFDIWGAGVSAAPTGWVVAGAGFVISRDTTNKKFGSAAVSVQRVGNDGGLNQVISNIWDNLGLLKGKTVTVGAWVRTTTGGVAAVHISDGVTTSTSAFHSGGGVFEFLKTSLSISNSATGVTVQLRIQGGNATAQYDGVTVVISGSPELDDFVPSGWRGRKCIIPLGSNVSQAQNLTRYYAPWGGTPSTNEIEASMPMPYRGVARNLRVVLDSAPAAGQTVTLTVRKNETTDTALTAQVTSAGRTAADVTNEVELAAADLVSGKGVSSATSGTRFVHATFEYEEIPASF